METESGQQRTELTTNCCNYWTKCDGQQGGAAEAEGSRIRGGW